MKVTDAIEAANEELAHRVSRRHLDEAQTYLLAKDPAMRVSITGWGDRTPLFRQA